MDCGGLLKLANGQDKTWCVAKPSSNDTALASNINFACSQLGTLGLSCNMIQQAGICYYPSTLINHASVVMNYYYQALGRHTWNCDFGGSALITISDPSYGSCQYGWEMGVAEVAQWTGRISLLIVIDKTWCVAKPSSNNTALASNIDFACSQLGNLGLSCDMIKEDGICFNPNTLINHASVVMNSYYHAFGRNIWNCDFSGSALITISDPSYGSCQYP
ncbi:Carbohydrate-binding X8 domain superfamily protein, putative [Theobroma cacao]|uniref:Carbohydrate-binding X8 domain superfamily protein, putative n=1 Tax=Theobroma cacao TaxID=3641 RepID=A0A061GL05_THECC|nr:Carbohydrate-binding X8 domain superfamily protein, putative [Theobroma cacao]